MQIREAQVPKFEQPPWGPPTLFFVFGEVVGREEGENVRGRGGSAGLGQ